MRVSELILIYKNIKINFRKKKKKKPNPPTCPPFKICTNSPNIKMAVVCVMYIYTPFKIVYNNNNNICNTQTAASHVILQDN